MAEADASQFDMADAGLAGGPEHYSRAGDKLRAARERAGIDRTELSLRIKINERHLEAIEASDFARLPARIYAVGFARSYAGAVGLDGAEIAAEVRRELNEQENPLSPRPSHQMDIEDPTKIPSRRLAWLAGAAALALVAAGVVFWRSYFVPAVDLPPVRDETPALVTPELTPAALVSPTAESAAIQRPTPAAEAATAPVPRTVAPSTRPRTPVPSAVRRAQASPSPIPEKLEPAPPHAADSAPATGEGT